MARAPSYLLLLRRDYASLGLSVLAGMALVAAFVMNASSSGADRDGTVWLGPAVMLALTVASATWAAVRHFRIRRLCTAGVEARGQVLIVASNSEDVWYTILAHRPTSQATCSRFWRTHAGRIGRS